MTYRTQSIDTSIEAEQFQVDLLRRAGALKRFRQARMLTESARTASWWAVRKAHPELSRLQAVLFFVKLVYGEQLAAELEQVFEQRKRNGMALNEEKMMLSQDMLDALNPVIDLLGKLNVPYLIGGSVASSLLGIPRSTNDADLVADLKFQQVGAFIAGLSPDEYYLSETAIIEAISRKRSFNLIHQPTMLKVDIFILKSEPFDLAEFARSVASPLQEGSPKLVKLASPEDMVLRKLTWFKAGGGTSEKQWLDVLGILKVQAGNLDKAYMQVWALQLAIADLLEHALEEAGL